MTNEIKVTKCWTKSDASLPSTIYVMLLPISSEYHQAVLMWREDYDAMRKELDELRGELKQTKMMLRNCLVELGLR